MTVQKEETITLGPIDLLAIEFPGNHFKGEILHELHAQVAAGTIRIIDLVIITKNDTGQVSALELQDLGPDAGGALAQLHATISQMLTNDDIEAVGEQLANESTAAVMLYEHTWATKAKKAIMAAGGKVLVQARVPHDVVAETLSDLAALGAPLP